MAVTLKCAACGAQVEFEDLSPLVEATCPGCEVQVRQRPGDERMAIPVSMNLPEEFHHVDLASVADKSSLLVGRYRKEEAGEGKTPSSDMVLAKALETLAHSITHLEDRLTKQERGLREVLEDDDGKDSNNGGAEGVKLVTEEKNGSSKGDEDVEEDVEGEVVQLEPEPDEEGSGRRARPVGATVLVRREAAKEAHAFRREKHTQSDWDEHAPRHGNRPTGFAWLMQNFPKTTIGITLLGAVALIVFTIASMNDMFTSEREKSNLPTNPLVRTTPLSELFDDDPIAAASEVVARGFLNATSARTAAPFVYESEAIAGKLEQFYRPISSPDDYTLALKSRAVTKNDQSIFAYRVSMPQEQPRMLVVLPEGAMPKVFWEFFAEVGDVSWDGFMRDKPLEEVEMRVWVYPGEDYFEPYNQEDWQCYILHDYAEKHKIYAFADRGASEDWRINDALTNEPVKFHRHSAVMATVRLKYMTDLPATSEQTAVVAEINEVVATSWLPKQFQGKGKTKGK